MQRKLVQMGQHTLMAAIPSKWVQRHGLKKGDSIEFTEVENKLITTSTAEIFERKTTINIISPTVEFVWRVILPAYLAGFDEVKATYSDPKAVPLIERFTRDLIGFEIVETGKKYLLVKTISKQLDEEFPVILKRTFLILKQMSQLMLYVLEKKDFSRLEELHSLEFTINKYCNFLRRIINRTGYKYPHFMYLIISYIELAANHLDYIQRYWKLHPKVKIQPEAIKEFRRLDDFLEKVHDLYYNYTPEKFRWIAEAQPHFYWFEKIKDPEIKFNFKSMAEYLVQISRQIVALHT